MAGSEFAELKGQFDRLHAQIVEILARLQELPKESVIVQDIPGPVGCLPFDKTDPPGPPPQLFADCEVRCGLDLKGSVVGDPILPADIIHAVSVVKRWNENMITVLRGR